MAMLFVTCVLATLSSGLDTRLVGTAADSAFSGVLRAFFFFLLKCEGSAGFAVGDVVVWLSPAVPTTDTKIGSRNFSRESSPAGPIVMSGRRGEVAST